MLQHKDTTILSEINDFFTTSEKVREEYGADQTRKQTKINRTNAIAMTKDILIAMFVRKDYNVTIEAFDDVVFKIREIIRSDRSNELNYRPKKLYSLNYMILIQITNITN